MAHSAGLQPNYNTERRSKRMILVNRLELILISQTFNPFYDDFVLHIKTALNNFIRFLLLRPDPPEGAGDHGAEAEDCRGHGSDAQPVLLVRRQQPEPSHPALLLQVHGQ